MSAAGGVLLVVQALVADGSDPDLALLARDLSEELIVHAASAGRANGLVVRSESELRMMIAQVKDQAELRPENCKKLEECLARMFDGEAEQVLRGTLGRLGESWVVTLKLIDLGTLGVVRSESCASESKEELIEQLRAATRAVLGATEARPSRFELPADGRKIGVVPITGSAAERRNADTLTEMLGVTIRELGFSAQTKGDVVSMINYATDRQSLSGAPLTEAIMEIAESSGVSMLVTGSIGRVERTHLIVLKLIDLEKGEVASRVLESYIGEEANLGGAMKYACARLFGRAPSGESGPLEIVTGVEGQYKIGGGRPEILPQLTAKTGLAAGKHQLHITAEGYYPYYADLYLFEHVPQRLRPTLEPTPKPLHKSPLFWSLAGLLAAATTTAVILIAMPNGSTYESSFER